MGKSRGAPVVLLVLLIGLLVGGMARGDELSEFEKGRNSYSGARYEEAVERFNEMLDSSNPEALQSPQLIEQARIYHAASLLALGRLADADEEIETILRVNPGAYPDPVIFPGVVLDRFTDVRGRIRQELEDQAREKARQERLRLKKEQALLQRERERVVRLEETAKQEVHTVHNSRWVAMVPFGVGQFQNQQPALAWPLLVGETALATTSIVTAAVAMNLQSKGTEPNVDPKRLNERIDTMKKVNQVSFAGFVLAAVGGVVHAQFTFEPSRKEIRKRELPDDLKASVTVTSVQGGALVGVGGTF